MIKENSVLQKQIEEDAFQKELLLGYAHCFERVPKGGIVILDDVGSHHAVQLFWSHFVKDYGITERLHPVGPHEAWFRKRTMAKLDRSKYRQVQLPELSGYSVTFAGDSKPQDMSVLPPKPARQWGKWAMEDESRV